MSVKSVIFVRLLTAGFGDCAIINCLISPVIISYNDRNGFRLSKAARSEMKEAFFSESETDRIT